MTQLSLGFIYTYLVILHFGISDLFMEVNKIKCIMSRPGTTKERVQESTLISEGNFSSLTEGDPPSSTDRMPEEPKDPIIVLNPYDNLVNISWFSPANGWKYVRHFLVKIEENIDHEIRYKYVLVNVGRVIRHKSKYTCLYYLPNGSEKLTITVWAFGPIKYTRNGHMTADVDKHCKSESISKKTSREHHQKRIDAQKCKCSDLFVSVKSYPSYISYKMKGESLPNNTNIRIQLLKKSEAKMKGDRIEKKITAVMKGNKELKGTFKVKKPGQYYIRIDRLCSDYYVNCNNTFKMHADVIRSQTVIITHDNSELQAMKYKDSRVPPDHSAVDMGMVSSRIKSNAEVGYQIVKLVIVIFVFGLAIILQIAIIFKWCSVLFHPRNISKRFHKYPTCVTIDVSGRTQTRILKPRRVAVIFTKDSSDHISRVYQLKSFLRRLGIDATLYDESVVPEMRSNWIQLGENIATESDVVLFVMSSRLITMCQPPSVSLKELSPTHDTQYQITESDNKLDSDTTTNKEIETETKAFKYSPFHKLPVVVMNSLKVGNIIPGISKPRLISVYLTTSVSSVKHLIPRMHRDHPSLMYDDVILKYTEEDNEINVGHIKKLADKIKS